MSYPVRTEIVSGSKTFHIVAVATSIVSLFYLFWRLFSGTVSPAIPIISGFYFFSECVLILNLFFFFALFWTRIRRIPTPLDEFDPPLAADRLPTLDIFVSTLNEPLEIVQRTVLAATQVNYPKHTTYVLDDGARKELEQWVQARQKQGDPIKYIARKKIPGMPDYAKAGNLNHALFQAGTSGEFIFLLDADHVCKANFAQILLPYFYNFDSATQDYSLNRVAYVQAPDRSWTNLEGNTLADDTRLFHGPQQQANDYLGAVWCTGSAVLLRREALAEIGGFYQATVTEDVPTGFILHSRGWESRFHSDPITCGMPPVNFTAMLRQRQRWTEGDLQQYIRLFPKIIWRLNWKQRLNYTIGPVSMVCRLFFIFALIFLPWLAIIQGKWVMALKPLDLVVCLAPFVILTRVVRILAFRPVSPRVFYLSEQFYWCTSASFGLGIFRVLFTSKKVKFWVSPKSKSAPQSFPNLTHLTGILFLTPLIYAVWTYLHSLKTYTSHFGLIWPAITLAWFLNALFCCWPLIYFSLFKARVCDDYFNDSIKDQETSASWINWVLLPTSFAPVVTALAGLWVLIKIALDQ